MKLAGFETVQAVDDDGNLVTGALEIDSRGHVVFVKEGEELLPAPTGSFGEHEETG